MTLYKYVRDWVDQYSFITRTTFKHTTFKLHYEIDDKERAKSLPFRASRDTLVKTINKIKKEIGYIENKKDLNIKVRQAIKEDDKRKPIIEI